MIDGDKQRTRLANERTYLAWWRTGIAALAAGFAIGRIVPEVVGGTSWPYIALGTALAAAGLVAIGYGVVRYRELDAALREDREPSAGDAVLLVLAGTGIAVGIASILLVLFAP
jgi:inner membrane protein YidH